MAFIGTTHNLVTASIDGTARVWDGDCGKCLHVLAGHEGTASVDGQNNQKHMFVAVHPRLMHAAGTSSATLRPSRLFLH